VNNHESNELKKGNCMPHYLVQVSYTSAALKALLKHPVDRIKVVKPAIEKLGGSLVGGWFSFGDQDVVLIADMPDNMAAAALAMAFGAGGALRSVKTTPLVELSEGVGAMKRAAKCGYRPPA
jgi:uncharacterized protein with GYD domain